jgi:hypothetical protein
VPWSELSYWVYKTWAKFDLLTLLINYCTAARGKIRRSSLVPYKFKTVFDRSVPSMHIDIQNPIHLFFTQRPHTV